MELRVNGDVTDRPSADDIVRAVEATPHPEEWFLVLEAGASRIEVDAEADGRFSVSAIDKGRELVAGTPIDADRLKKVLLKFLAHDSTWRDAGFWTVAPARSAASSAAPRPSSASSASPPPPAWAGMIIAGVVGASALLAITHREWRLHVPFADTAWFWIGLVAASFVAILVVALLVKMIEVRRAASWAKTTGRIMRSGTEAKHSGAAGRATKVSTVPAVEYEFAVGGQTWRGNRIAIREDIGGANTAATLARYPVGAVVSVYYDPADPAHCLLERELPKGIGKGLASLVAIVAALAAAGTWLATGGPRLAADLLPGARTHPGLVVFALCFGLAVLLFFRASLRSSRQAAGWPIVRGTVTESGVEPVEETDDGTTRTTWLPAVEYRYRVGGVEYFSRQIKLGVAVSAGKGYAEKVAARYPRGSEVDVRYDPADPGSAALENPTRLHWLLLVIALACFAFAAWAGGLF
jgi:hypothetical protein